MVIYPSDKFKKSFGKLPVHIKEKAVRRDKIFQANPFNPALNTHKPKGRLSNYRSYSVDENYRVLFRFARKDRVIYFDIGTHEIYK